MDHENEIAGKILRLIAETLPASRKSETFTGDAKLKEEIFVDSILVISFIGKIKDCFQVDLIDRLDALVEVTTLAELNLFMADLLQHQNTESGGV
jgi:acyl carrier protein